MLRIDQVRLSCEPERENAEKELCRRLIRKAARILKISPGAINALRICRHAIDARRKPELADVYTVEVETDAATEKRILAAPPAHVTEAPVRMPYVQAECGGEAMEHRPVVAGTGPAGLFCALMLARASYRPLVLERGDDPDERDARIAAFRDGGVLDPESNVQFGAGGAGTYSDGKLTTGVRDPAGLGQEILQTFVRMGAPEDILTEAMPHIGTDVLGRVVRGILDEIRSLGGEIRFRTRLEGIRTGADGALCGIGTSDGDIAARVLVAALGHSARDTLQSLQRSGIAMEQKAFAVGYRVAHPQEMIDRAQYGRVSGGPLPAAVYKLTHTPEGGRGVYSFCMCPGGRIINASSEPGYLCVNGMSEHARDGAYANSAVVVTVTPADYASDGDPLAGVAFQRRLEQAAYLAGDGRIPVACLGDLAARSGDDSFGKPGGPRPVRIEEAFFGDGFREADLTGILPAKLRTPILSAMHVFGRRIRGFDAPETLFAGVESRTSSPVRMLRAENGTSLSCDGFYPCGEGAGYAGGIMSAAMDGIRTAEQIIRRYARP